MSNDTNRLLRYMYGELDDADDLERALVERPALFEQWFAFHEVKQQLDAQPPARPDASVVDGLVEQARMAADDRDTDNVARPTAQPDPSRPFVHGDGVPHEADTWCTITVPSDARRAERTAKTAPRSSHEATSRAGAAAQAAPWALALALAVILVMSGSPYTPASPEAESPMAATASAELPAWDAPDRRTDLHRQAAALSERTALPDPMPPTASTTP